MTKKDYSKFGDNKLNQTPAFPGFRRDPLMIPIRLWEGLQAAMNSTVYVHITCI